MKPIKTFILTAMAVCMGITSVHAGTFNANARTKRIPAGTVFKLEFLQPIGTFSGGMGDSFVATIKNEQTSDTGVILPAGTVVRGSISEVKSSKRFSRGAKLYLDFDHVVTPAGRQIPLDMAVCQFDNIYYDGGLYKNLGYGEAVKSNYNRGRDIAKNSIEYSLKVKESAPGMQYITAPVCAIGGFFGGAGYFVGDSIADMFRKGQEVNINTGDIISVRLINPIDIPVY